MPCYLNEEHLKRNVKGFFFICQSKTKECDEIIVNKFHKDSIGPQEQNLKYSYIKNLN